MNRTIEASFFPEVAEPLKKACILIIDSDRDFTYSAKRALEMIGRYFVSEETDASKALQTAQNLKPDLILLDIAMPETDPSEVAARMNPIRHCIEYRLSF